ncbi:MAG TPA: hypothetical protein VFX79_01095 [Candidatus Saccharimonadales bacterium]|nr:hypothetical protein [Candidatus Saccharimonadales bacterium]
MTEASLGAMAEVRVRLPEEHVQKLVDEIQGMGFADKSDIDVVPAEPIVTEFFDADEGPIEVITLSTFQHFARYIEARDSERNLESVATRTYNTLIQQLDEKHVHRGHASGNDSKDIVPLGIRADDILEIAQEVRDGSEDAPYLGRGGMSYCFDIFSEAFQTNREADTEAVNNKLIGLGTSALATQRHELEMRFGRGGQA